LLILHNVARAERHILTLIVFVAPCLLFPLKDADRLASKVVDHDLSQFARPIILDLVLCPRNNKQIALVAASVPLRSDDDLGTGADDPVVLPVHKTHGDLLEL